MQVKEKIIEDVAVLQLKGNLMAEPEISKLREKIQSLVGDGITKVVADLGSVKWMNSSGLGALIASLTSLRNKGGDLRLANVAEKIQSLFVVTQLIKVFKTYETTDRAVASFKSGK